MKFKTGDRVKFLNDTGSGEIVSFIDKKTALVRIEDDFEVPVLLSDLVVEAGVYYDNDEAQQTGYAFGDSDYENYSENAVQISKVNDGGEPFEAEAAEATEDDEIVLLFVPAAGSTSFGVYLANSSSYQLKYVISRNIEGEQVVFGEGELEPGLKVMVGSYSPPNLDEEEAFRIQILFYNAQFYSYLPPLDAMIRFEAAELYNSDHWMENEYFEEKSVVHVLHDWKRKKEVMPVVDPEEIRKAMFTKGDAVHIKKQAASGGREVDLHIEKLVDNHNGLSNSEIINIQMARFRTALETAILHQEKRVVFIHGVGNGKLKNEIRRTLDREFRKLRYQDASFKEYGYGATMVLL